MAVLKKGVFWITKPDSVFESAIFLALPCDPSGSFTDTCIDPKLLSKNGAALNHEKVWNTLEKSITGGKKFNYYPRGRVEIRRGKAVIYANQNIVSNDLKGWAVRTFHLTNANGILSVILKADGSNHYQCHLDKK